ncbi:MULTISPECIES: TadE/TadG family type IV pilus assembly protein [unclassified Streptomyces]|uniref:TadE/TadG family type IV pilus assembly protein n=1 Tax=unclassified Streptomyces TaxID=2593676 RepID=UPI0016600BE9|nr:MULTISPECIES: TadE/TadG family type IV pilus assembly protein [unclassified Streptomyces]MBD0711408.1 septum formation initiator [Streptomyces sp. CBMA291]MBD0713479.1 septum formation initiator [Streptomyces sp. CBMA370]
MAVLRDDDGGQVAVEFAGMVPLILITLALLWQLVLVGYAYILAGNAADEAARAAAVGDDCGEAALRHLDGAWASGATPSCSRGGGLATATVSIDVPLLVPGLGGLFPVKAKAAAVDEEGLEK